MNTKTRILRTKLSYWMFKKKVLIITGARQVGKTTLLEMLFSKEEALWLNGDDQALRIRLEQINSEGIRDLIGNHKIVIIDEVQRLLNPGLLLKMMIDNFKEVQFIATGSSALEISDKIFEPLTGRHILFHLYPFSQEELYPQKSNYELEQTLPFHLRFGSYPDVCNNPSDAETLLKNLSSQYLYKDVLIWKDIRKPELLDKLLKLLAFQVCSEVSINELANALKVKSETVENYIDLLEKSFVVFRLKAYSTNERKEVTKMNKIYFWDNGIRNAIIEDFRPLELRNDIGALWENFLISERMKSKAWKEIGAKSYFWRNLQQREVDYLEEQYGELTAYEIKWNSEKKHKITLAFTNAYPNAKTEIITPLNFKEFCFIENK
ncbi:MAG: ATP-binding protein [Flavobacteriia bacterium]|nr:ATP-binding protein [Flavobacteriia bacterium]